MKDSLVIAVPRAERSPISWETHMSFMAMQQHLVTHFDGELRMATVEGAVIEDNRNELLEQSRGSYLMFIDSDMTFKEDAVWNLYQTMKEKDLDVLCGLFFVGYKPYGPAMLRPFPKEGALDPKELKYHDYPKDSLFEIGACGMAFTLISPRVTRSISKFPFRRLAGPNNLHGEDISFCVKAYTEGFQIWCDSRVKIGHIRSFAINEENYLTENV